MMIERTSPRAPRRSPLRAARPHPLTCELHREHARASRTAAASSRGWRPRRRCGRRGTWLRTKPSARQARAPETFVGLTWRPMVHPFARDLQAATMPSALQHAWKLSGAQAMSQPTRRNFLTATGGILTAAAVAGPFIRTSRTAAAEPEKKIGFAIVGLGRFGAGQLLRSLPEC